MWININGCINFFFRIVTAYVNQTCRCGPLLNQTRIIRLPLHYGPGVVSRMLKKIIQALVDSAVNPAQIFNNLVTSASSSTITGKGDRGRCESTLNISIPIINLLWSSHQFLAALPHQVAVQRRWKNCQY